MLSPRPLSSCFCAIAACSSSFCFRVLNCGWSLILLCGTSEFCDTTERQCPPEPRLSRFILSLLRYFSETLRGWTLNIGLFRRQLRLWSLRPSLSHNRNSEFCNRRIRAHSYRFGQWRWGIRPFWDLERAGNRVARLVVLFRQHGRVCRSRFEFALCQLVVNHNDIHRQGNPAY